MLAPVELDDQMSLHANEIDDVVTHRNLATEVVASDLFTAEPHPQIALGIGHPSSELAASL